MSTFDPAKHPPAGSGKFSRRQQTEEEISLVEAEVSTLGKILPKETFAAWKRIVPVVPEWAYLSGGTALAVHLKHRVSRDLDFFTEQPFDALALADMLIQQYRDFAPTLVEDGTVNGVLADAKIQFLDASTQRVLVETTEFAGIRIASVEDILATKIKVIGDRPALRDYFDLMMIEKQTDLTVEEGFRLYVQKYEEGRVSTTAIPHLLTGLGYFGDVDEDPGLPASKAEVERYWTGRHKAVASSLYF